MRSRRFLSILALVFCYTFSASAALYYEPFDYAPTGSALAGKGTPPWTYVGTGANSADPTIASGSLSYAGEQASAGNSVITNRTQSGSDRVTLPFGISAGTIYYSMIVRVNDMAGLTNTTTGSFFAGLNNTAGARTSITSAGAGAFIHRDAVDTAAYNLGIGVSTANNDRKFDTTAYHAGDILFVVAAYEFVTGTDNDNAYLWINPPLASLGTETAPAPTVSSLGAADATTASDNAGALVSFFLRNNSVEPAQIQVDEVRVDNTWAGVTAPEPTALSLILLALPITLRRKHM